MTLGATLGVTLGEVDWDLGVGTHLTLGGCRLYVSMRHTHPRSNAQGEKTQGHCFLCVGEFICRFVGLLVVEVMRDEAMKVVTGPGRVLKSFVPGLSPGYEAILAEVDRVPEEGDLKISKLLVGDGV